MPVISRVFPCISTLWDHLHPFSNPLSIPSPVCMYAAALGVCEGEGLLPALISLQ